MTEQPSRLRSALPVAQKAGFPDDLSPLQEDVVEDLAKAAYRVTGQASVGGAPVSYTCEVAPDASDKLRGLGVTRLDVVPC